MGIVKEKLLDSSVRPSVVTDCVQLVDDEVAAKKGVSGMMIKGGYKAFKAIKPALVKEAVEHLLEDFVGVIDKHYDEYIKGDPDKSKSFDQWAGRRDKSIADDLLKITDDIMDRSKKTAIKKIYSGMRKVAQGQVATAVPAVGRLVVKHV